MASILIRNMDHNTKRCLRLRAAANGRSMEEEACAILTRALSGTKRAKTNLYDSIRKYFEPLGGVDLPALPREPMRNPTNFSK
jgi:plasmid stability protein